MRGWVFVQTREVVFSFFTETAYLVYMILLRAYLTILIPSFPCAIFISFFFESHHTQSFIYTFLFLFLCFGVPLLSAFSLSSFLTFFLLRFFQYYMDVADYDNLIRAVKRHGCVHWFSLLCSFWSFYVSCFFVFVFLLVVMLF